MTLDVPFQECKALGFDTIELNAGSLKLPEEALLRLVRLIKTSGLQAKPLFSVKFDSSDIPPSGDRAFGAYIVPVKQNSGNYNKQSLSNALV
jgi:phosphosulfolactate synthase (CoM biosynthesis protein A)